LDFVRYYEYDITLAQPSSAPGTPRSSQSYEEVASLASGTLASPVAFDISNQANPEKKT